MIIRALIKAPWKSPTEDSYVEPVDKFGIFTLGFIFVLLLDAATEVCKRLFNENRTWFW